MMIHRYWPWITTIIILLTIINDYSTKWLLFTIFMMFTIILRLTIIDEDYESPLWMMS